MNAGQVVPIIVALVSGLLAYFIQNAIANKSKSGSPRTAEAETVFSEMRQIKDEYKEELKAARARITELEKRVDELEDLLAGRRDDERRAHGQGS
jgi:F0F1-type ATP synthase membrane subunit b/b'